MSTAAAKVRTPLFDHVAVLGLGLIGASFCLAMRMHGLAGYITGYSRSQETRDIATKLGLADTIVANPQACVEQADCVILATPIGSYESLMAAIATSLQPGAIVTDVGSVKAAPIRMITPHLPEGVWFVPGHPIAGTEESGPRAGFPELFIGRWCILTPPPQLTADAPHIVEKIATLWRECGMNIDYMDPEHHDLALAVISHLPHLVSYNIVGTARDMEWVTDSEIIRLSASGFRDFTRLAASDPVMWRDIFLHNREHLLEVLARFTEELARLQRAIRWGDRDFLFEKLSQTRSIRRDIIEAGQDVAMPDFGRPRSSVWEKE